MDTIMRELPELVQSVPQDANIVQDDTVELRDRLEALPQELYDDIFELTFTPDSPSSPTEMIIDENYKPPAQLQVNKSTCKTVVEAYYENTIFKSKGLEHWAKWLSSLEPSPIEKITTIRLDMSPPDCPDLWQAVNRILRERLEDAFEQLAYFKNIDGSANFEWEFVEKIMENVHMNARKKLPGGRFEDIWLSRKTHPSEMWMAMGGTWESLHMAGPEFIELWDVDSEGQAFFRGVGTMW